MILSALAQMGKATDFDIPATWLLWPLASYLTWAVFAIVWWAGGIGLGRYSLGALGTIYLDLSGLLGLIGIFALATSLGSSFVLYAIMNRINSHSARTQLLLSRTLDALESRIGSQPSPASITLNSAEGSMQILTYAERERSSFLWALLSMIPFIGWIFVIAEQWLVSRDLATHQRLESAVLDDVGRTMKTVGLEGFQWPSVQIHSRNSLAIVAIIICFLESFSTIVLDLRGALVLVYLTLGIFSLIWIDLSTRDPRHHFQFHSLVENSIVRSLGDPTGLDGRPV